MSGSLEMWNCHPITGQIGDQVGFCLTSSSVAQMLVNWTGFDPPRLARFLVSDLGGKNPVSAENWLESHPIEALMAAWNAGAPASAKHRQEVLHKRWPELATAISNVEVNFRMGDHNG